MGDEFCVGEIRIFAGAYDPVTWLHCNGQLLPISEYETLFDQIGNRFGGDVNIGTFNLPNLPDPAPGLRYIICFAGDFQNLVGYVGQVRLFAGPMTQDAWLPCNGQLLPIQQFTELFSIIGVGVQGNGTTNFQLPNLAAPPGMQYLICNYGVYPYNS